MEQDRTGGKPTGPVPDSTEHGTVPRPAAPSFEDDQGKSGDQIRPGASKQAFRCNVPKPGCTCDCHPAPREETMCSHAGATSCAACPSQPAITASALSSLHAAGCALSAALPTRARGHRRAASHPSAHIATSDVSQAAVVWTCHRLLPRDPSTALCCSASMRLLLVQPQAGAARAGGAVAWCLVALLVLHPLPLQARGGAAWL